jgi:multicomponent Na+:H+ antiporter subunit D
MLYMMTGTLNISDLAVRIGGDAHALPIKAAMAFFTIGLALKIAVFPLHLWLTNAYTNAPSFVSSFLAATATKVGIYVLIRICYSLFGKHFSFEVLPLGEILTTLGVVAMIAGSLVAVYERNIKRMLAYSSVAQVGYIMVAIGLATAAGLAASLAHIVAHALTKAALFVAVGLVFTYVGGVRLTHFRGLGARLPWVSAAFVLAGLSLIGVPGTAGFISKWLLLSAVYQQGLWVVFAAILLSSLLALVYVWRVVEVMYFARPRRGRKAVFKAPLGVVSLWILVVLILVVGLYSEPIVTLTSRITEQWY